MIIKTKCSTFSQNILYQSTNSHTYNISIYACCMLGEKIPSMSAKTFISFVENQQLVKSGMTFAKHNVNMAIP